MKKKILSTDDPKFETCKGRVVIARDDFPPNPMKDYDQVFLVWSNIPNEMSGSPNAENPYEDVLDEDGCETGKRRLKAGIVAFPVTALIHSGIWLKLGGGFAEDPCGWDTTHGALFMYTTKKRFEEMCAPWRTVPDGDGRREALSDAEWIACLRKIAEEELRLIQKWIDHDCYWYKTEEAVRFVKKYEDGRKEEIGVEWEAGPDSCGGYYVDKADEIDFPRLADWEVFDKTGKFVGQEYEVPEK